jgi:hypothetical protein
MRKCALGVRDKEELKFTCKCIKKKGGTHVWRKRE